MKPSSSSGFYRKVVLGALGRMRRGRLRLELPGGGVVLLGSGDPWQEAAAAPGALALAPEASIRVVRESFFIRCVLYGDVGFAEAYMDGDWETPDAAAVIAWFLLNLDAAPTLTGSRARALGVNVLRAFNRIGQVLRPNSPRIARRNIRDHYDLSNDFFKLWLDPAMMYSCARWEGPDAGLEEAQAAKNESLCRKLRLSAGDRVLEIGTGWGGWSIHAARHHGCHVTTLTISREQHALARERVAAAGLADRIDVRLQDYRDLPRGEAYDKLVSIEMLEAVGHRYLPDWCALVSRALRPEGLMALQFITCPDARYDELRGGVDFIQKHIFPGSVLLSANRLNGLLASQGGFVLQSLEDMGGHYPRTLAAWHEGFAARLDAVRALGFEERFIRKWSYYLRYCQAAFAMRNISVVQTVHTRPNNLRFA